MNTLAEFDDHRLVSFVQDKTSGLKAYIALHRGLNGRPSFGATRIWNYGSQEAALKDVLKLSRIMSYKAAMAGLPFGGAKGVIISDGKMSPAARARLLKTYIQAVNSFAGNFITGADAGISAQDLKLMRRHSNYLVGFKYNCVGYTALGLWLAVETCLKHYFGKKDLAERSVAIQGLGKVGQEFLRLLYPCAKKIFAADLDRAKLKNLKKLFPKIEIVSVDQIHKMPVTIYSPCALTASINSKTVNQLRCQIIAGGENNQLENSSIGERLYQKGILYAPDYLVNAGGLITVVDEFTNQRYSEERVRRKVAQIPQTLESILNESQKRHRAPNLIADERARKIIEKNYV